MSKKTGEIRKCYDLDFEYRLEVSRAESNFDRACDEARKVMAIQFGVDDDGHTDLVDPWNRSSCSLQMRFIGYRCVSSMSGCQHVYEFGIMAASNRNA